MIEVFEVQGETWLIQAYLDKVAKANAKAKRAGLPAGFTGTITGTVQVTRSRGGLEFTVEEQVLEISGNSQAKPGWSFAATVDWSNEGGQPVLHTLPTYEGPTLPRPTSKVCDHCSTVRSRKETFLVVGPDHEVKQVGRQCLTAFTGIPLGWVSAAQGIVQGDEDDYWGWGHKVDPTFDLESVLRLSIALTDALGFVSRNAAENNHRLTSTRDDFTLLWYGPPRGGSPADQRERERFQMLEALLEQRTRTDAEVDAEVEAILAWGASLAGADSDYLQNLHAVLGAERVGRRSLGYTISAPAAYRRDRDRQAKRAAAKAKVKGPVPEGRIQVVGKIATVREQQGQFGTQWKMRVVHADGWAVWGSIPRSIFDEALVGAEVAFMATVERSKDDETFGFFTRPTKASVLATAE